MPIRKKKSMPKRWSVGKPRHLYLVLDDWSWGYSIRKIDLSFGDPDQQLIPVMQRLPSAWFRFQGMRGYPKSILGALDNMILALTPLWYGVNHYQLGHAVIDIHARTLINGPWGHDQWLDVGNIMCIPVGDKLYCLHSNSFRVFYQVRGDAYAYYFLWAWHDLPKPIFRCEHVTSYAVHPDERTIFVSGCFGVPATFSIDIADPATFRVNETVIHEWKQHGMWQLPFTGCGHFDPELDAWVGLSAQLDTIGHICACDVVSTNSDTSHQQCPALKVSKEKLFSEVPAERHVGATLVYMGGGSKFCLLEGIFIQADLADQPTESVERNEDFVVELDESDSDETNEYSVREVNETDSDETNEYSVGEVNETDSDEMNEYSGDEVNEKQDQKRFLRLTTFSLKYDKSGDLTTGNSRRVWYYSVPQGVTDSMLECPVAFWM